MVADPESRPRIAKVWAKNFRSIESAELEFGPLTVLVGPNASGKSNLMDTLWFLGDVARLGLEAAITRRGGIDSIGRKSPTGRVLGPEIGYRCGFPWGTLEYTFTLTRRGKGRVSGQAGVCQARTHRFGSSPTGVCVYQRKTYQA